MHAGKSLKWMLGNTDPETRLKGFSWAQVFEQDGAAAAEGAESKNHFTDKQTCYFYSVLCIYVGIFIPLTRPWSCRDELSRLSWMYFEFRMKFAFLNKPSLFDCERLLHLVFISCLFFGQTSKLHFHSLRPGNVRRVLSESGLVLFQSDRLFNSTCVLLPSVSQLNRNVFIRWDDQLPLSVTQ